MRAPRRPQQPRWNLSGDTLAWGAAISVCNRVEAPVVRIETSAPVRDGSEALRARRSECSRCYWRFQDFDGVEAFLWERLACRGYFFDVPHGFSAPEIGIAPAALRRCSGPCTETRWTGSWARPRETRIVTRRGTRMDYESRAHAIIELFDVAGTCKFSERLA